MRERLIAVITPVQPENQQKPQEPALRESLGEKKLPFKQRLAVQVLDEMNIPLVHKRLLFFYHLWQQTGSFSQIKEFGEIREDPTIDSILNQVMDNDGLVKDFEEFDFEYRRKLTEKKINNKLLKPQNHLSMNESEKYLLESMEKAEEVLKLKTEGKTNLDVSKELGISIKKTENIARALIFFKKIKPTKSGEKKVEIQNEFLNRVKEFRINNFGNQEISSILGVGIEKVEHAARFLLTLKLIEPISKTDALKTRWQRKEKKIEILKFLDTLDQDKKISVRKIHLLSRIDIGYDQFLSIYHELENEREVPPIRKAKN